MAQHDPHSRHGTVAQHEFGLKFRSVRCADDNVVRRSVHVSIPTAEHTNAKIVASSRHAS